MVKRTMNIQNQKEQFHVHDLWLCYFSSEEILLCLPKKRLQDVLKTVDTYKHIFQIAGTIIQGIYQIDKLKKERKQAIQTF